MLKKRIFKISVIAVTIVSVLCGCSKDYISIFDGTDKNALSPVELFSNGYRISEEYYNLPVAVFNAMGVGQLKDGVAVINSKENLLSIVEASPEHPNFPDVDYTKYSLVFCKFCEGDGGFFMESQRVKVKGSDITLYIEVRRAVGGLAVPTEFYSMALYPKLPDGKAELVRWNNY